MKTDQALPGRCALCNGEVLYIVLGPPRKTGYGIEDGCEIVNAEPEVFGGQRGYLPRSDESGLFRPARLEHRIPRYRSHRCGSATRRKVAAYGVA